MSGDETGGRLGPQEGEAGRDGKPLPSLPVRVAQVFFSPGHLGEALAEKPAWAAALAVGAVLVLAQTLLIPAEVWDAAFREAVLARGQELPEGFSAGGTMMRVSAVVFGALGYVLVTCFFAAVVTLIFAFVMGDEGRYRQYLALVGHAWLIPAFIGLALLPLRVSQQNPQLTLNVGSFLFFLREGYLSKVATMMDLSQLWAWLVVAQGAHAVDPRRSFASAATAVMVLFVATAMLFALIPGVG